MAGSLGIDNFKGDAPTLAVCCMVKVCFQTLPWVAVRRALRFVVEPPRLIADPSIPFFPYGKVAMGE